MEIGNRKIGLVRTRFVVEKQPPTDNGMDVALCNLDGNADAVEFCPHDSYHHVLAASTYTLQEGDRPSQARSISLFNVDADLGRLDLFHRIETAGIFDIKWNLVEGCVSPFLAEADADGYLRIHGLECCSDEAQGFCLREITDEKISSAMCLCLDWNPSTTSITVGLSDGSVSIASIMESQLETQELWKAHDFEVWTALFDTHQPQLVYTGSNDCKFSCWGLRDGPSKLAFQNTKVHTMGVCCIVKNPNDLNIILTSSSYDEYLRVWDVRSISRLVNETSICLGGGVWRIKYHSFVTGLVLTTCMHNEFSVVKVNGDKAEVIETYSKHESLAYGADWHREKSFREGKRNSTLVATCSFYDRLLRLWTPESVLLDSVL